MFFDEKFSFTLNALRQNRQLVFEPEIPYDRVAAYGGHPSVHLRFSNWLCILEIVRTHFGGRAGSEKKSKAAGIKTAKEPVKISARTTFW